MGIAAISAVSRAAELGASDRTRALGADSTALDAKQRAAACPPGTLPDARVCIPVPEHMTSDGPENVAQANVQPTRGGGLRAYNHIPRRPDRPADWAAYQLPLEGAPSVVSSYDLDLAPEQQRVGPVGVGHGGVDLAALRGTPVRLVALAHQEGDAEVLHVGTLFGISVATLHALREAGRLRNYVVVFGHLETAAPGLALGAVLKTGAAIGRVGDTGSPGRVHLHLEVRQVREGIDARTLRASELVEEAKTIACDPRNVLVLR